MHGIPNPARGRAEIGIVGTGVHGLSAAGIGHTVLSPDDLARLLLGDADPGLAQFSPGRFAAG
ncbi:hypothetical protein ACFO1B_13080 [Dactylosporangium siamense]|uniref:Uncharacterized protein n=1 Tax=Dactylosporangium siamense TaxID=685454 RepID=A0A919PVM9_9ACTN|nr:hypothetical protein [Dactylosporangium siamense]GIG49220.1 hypothetical protein Dsi01nite_072610 [Dactylosporangium siamense]